MIRILTFLLIVLLAATAQAKAGEPRLTLLFCGNTEGEVRPCPTWGGKTLGGLARRVSAQKAFKQEATQNAPVYFLAGGYEFVAPETAAPPSRKRLEFLAKAFDTLNHDLLFVTRYEREILSKVGVKPRRAWLGSDRLEQHILQAKDGPKIAVLLLPPLPKGAKSVPQNLIHQVENAVRALRGSMKLVVAMSPWGYAPEQELLKANGPLPDILLGSGPGIGITGMVAAGGKTIWVRSFTQGKSVQRIQVLDWPERNSTFKWTEGKNIRMTLDGLTDQYQENPQLLTLMQHMGTD